MRDILPNYIELFGAPGVGKSYIVSGIMRNNKKYYPSILSQHSSEKQIFIEGIKRKPTNILKLLIKPRNIYYTLNLRYKKIIKNEANIKYINSEIEKKILEIMGINFIHPIKKRLLVYFSIQVILNNYKIISAGNILQHGLAKAVHLDDYESFLINFCKYCPIPSTAIWVRAKKNMIRKRIISRDNRYREMHLKNLEKYLICSEIMFENIKKRGIIIDSINSDETDERIFNKINEIIY